MFTFILKYALQQNEFTGQWNFAKADHRLAGEVQSASSSDPQAGTPTRRWEAPLQKASFQETPTHFSHMHPHKHRNVDMPTISMFSVSSLQ